MNASTTNLTFRGLLFDDADPKKSTDELRGRLDPDLLVGILPGVSKALRLAGLGEVARVIDRLLGTDVFGMVSAGWRRYAALREAALRTRESPGSREAVELATRRISSRYEPRVDVYLDGVKTGDVDFTLQLEATTVGMVGIVVAARLDAIEAGHIDLEGGLSCEGMELATGQKRIDLAGQMPLGDGIPLLEAS